jgi:hypothetical protein
MQKRYLTINCIIRKNQIEVARDKFIGQDETLLHSVDSVDRLANMIRSGFPEAQITWAFSWLALFDQSERYIAIRKRVLEYQNQFGDEITFIPGGFFANRYNTREQINLDLDEACDYITTWTNHPPRSIIAGFLAANNIDHAAAKLGVVGVQGNIWSQYAIDNQDGDGSIAYPYYPSKEHFCKPAQTDADFISAPNFDGWTVDFFNARLAGVKGARKNSRLGVGPIETLGNLKGKKGLQELQAVTTAHYQDSMAFNPFTWITVNIETVLVHQIPDLPYITKWIQWIKQNWPDVVCPPLSRFALDFKHEFPNNDRLAYELHQKGNGVGASNPKEEIIWFMNKKFRLGILKDKRNRKSVFDYTDYTHHYQEPSGLGERNWSLMGDMNQKQIRKQDKPQLLESWPQWVAIKPKLEKIYNYSD